MLISPFLVEGLVSVSDSGLVSEDMGVVTPIDLTLYENQSVLMSISHWPWKPYESRWGLGSCYWTPTGKCPFGHQDYPDKMLNWNQSGTLTQNDGVWSVGGEILPEVKFLDGHRCRVIMVQNPDSFDSLGDVSKQTEAITLLLKASENLRKAFCHHGC